MSSPISRAIVRFASRLQALAQPKIEFRQMYLLEHSRKVRAAVKMPLGYLGGAKSLAAIREALGMSSAVLAQRLDISASGLRKLEQAEAADAITLATLRRVAEALDCELQYVLVPRQSLRQMRWQQAIGRARDRQQRASRTMALEAQQSEASSLIQQEQLDEMAQEILRSGGARLWD